MSDMLDLFLKWVRHFFLWAVLLMVIVTVTTYLITLSLIITLSSPNEVVQAFHQIHFAERSRPILADFLVRYALSTNAQVSFLEEYPIEVWEEVAEIILPEGWVAENTDHILRISLSWLTSEYSNIPNINIDLAVPLEVLQSPRGSLAILPLLQNMPDCSEDTKERVDDGSEWISCLPRDQNITGIAQSNAELVKESLPDEISTSYLQTANLITNEIYLVVKRIHNSYKVLVEVRDFSLSLSFFLFGIYCLLHSLSLRHLGRQIAFPFFAACGLSIAIILVWRVFLEKGLRLFLTSGFFSIQIETLTLISDLIHAVSGLILKYWINSTLLLLLLAAFLWLLTNGLENLIKIRSIRAKSSHQPKRGIRKLFR